MELTKEELAQQVKDTYNKGIATGKTREEVIGAMKNELKTTGQYDTAKQIATGIQTPDRKTELEGLIKSGQGSASVNAEYNRLTGNNQGAREVMIGSTEAQKTMQTTITPEEAGQMVQAGVKDVGEGVKPDMTAGTKEDFKQAMDTTKVTTQETPTGTVTTTETPKNTGITAETQWENTSKTLGDLEQIVEARYPGAVATQNADGTITSEINGEKFQWKIGADGKPAKTSLGKVGILPADKDTLFNTMLVGGQVDKNSPDYADVKKRYDKYNMFNTMTDSQLSDSLATGLLLPGTETYNDLIKDPIQAERIKKAQIVNTINGNTKSDEEILASKSDDIGNIKVNVGGEEMTIADAMANNYIDQNEYNSMTNTPEITAQQNDYKKQKEEVLKLQAEYDGIEDEVEQTLKGTGATKRARDRMIRNKQKELLGPLNLAINMANLSLGMLTQLKEDKTKLFTTNLGLYQAKQAEASQLAQEQRQQAFQSAQDVKNFEQQKEIMKLQQDYQKADIQTDIIQVGNKNVLINRKTGDTIKSFDMPTETTKNDYIKMGEDSLYDPVSKTWITKPGTTTSTTGTPVSTIDLLKGAEGFRDKAYQDVAGNWTIGYGFTSVNGKPVKAGDTITQQEADAQLANKAQQYTKFANLVKVPLSDAQKSALTSFEYNLGSGIWTKSKGGAQEVINKINAGDFAGAGEEMKKFVNAGGKFYQGLLNRRNKEADLLNQTGTTTGTSYTDQQIGEISYLVELQEKNPTQASKDMKELGYSPKDLANYKAGNMPLTEKQKNSSVEVTNSIKDLIINYDWNDAVGKFDYSRVLGLQGAEDAKLAIDNLVAKLTLPNLGVLKGPMSDKDIEFIKSASSKLGTTQSNKSFETNIIDAYNLSARRAGLPEIKTLSDINKTPTTQTAGKTSTQYGGKVYTFN